jgi:hypothetical protein
MKRYKRGDASDNTYALVYGGVNPDWAIQDPVIVFEGDADWDMVSTKVMGLAPSYTDNYSNDLYRLAGHSIIKTPKYTTLANRKWILSETLLSSWMWDNLFGDWKANESFREFIGESRDGDLQAFKNIQANSLSPSDFTRIFNKKLGDNWIEIIVSTPLYYQILNYYREHYPNRFADIFKIDDYYFTEILSEEYTSDHQPETLSIAYNNAIWIPFKQMMEIDSTFLMDNLFGEF